MADYVDVFEEIVRLRREGTPAALATIVGTRGSTPGQETMRLLVLEDGTFLGTVGGGCLEAEVYEAAKASIGIRAGGVEQNASHRARGIDATVDAFSYGRRRVPTIQRKLLDNRVRERVEQYESRAGKRAWVITTLPLPLSELLSHRL